jgi:ribosome-binding protein aMBF1 (putative translation factor)
MTKKETKIIEEMIKNNPYCGSSLDEHIEEQKKKDPKFAEAFDKEMLLLEMAQKVKELRKKKKLTQRSLAKKAGITQSVIARLESAENTRIPSYGLLKKLSAVLEVPFYYGFSKTGRI